jgi:hypothetical protein
MRDWRLREMVQTADNEISTQKQRLHDSSICSKPNEEYAGYLKKVSENIDHANAILQTVQLMYIV